MAVEIIDRLEVEFEAESSRVSRDIDRFFSRLLPNSGDGRDRLYEAMRHATLGGGKRLRPLLTSASARLFAIDPDRALRVGAAIEAIHVYSLIHDDLPCMDNDDLRRGKPTVALARRSARRKRYWRATACMRWRSKSWRIRQPTTTRSSGLTW